MINLISNSDLCNSSTWLVTVCNDLSDGLCSQIIVRYAFTVKYFKNLTPWLDSQEVNILTYVRYVLFSEFL